MVSAKAGVERDHVSRSHWLGELETERPLSEEGQVMLATTFFQWLETFEKDFSFFRPFYELSETFVVN